jgi:UDP-N-acetylglucosamine 2-epimerase (non-hydrolysing)
MGNTQVRSQKQNYLLFDMTYPNIITEGKMKKILAVFGTRPDAIKMCPLIIELKKRSGVQTVVCVTGQHREMLHGVLEDFGIVPDYDLSVMKEGQSLFDITECIMQGIKPVLEAETPDIVLVHGDTTTAFAAALSAFYKQIPIGHVEAGLRTYSIRSPYPEEFNRRAVSLLSDIDFAPTKSARYALISDGKNPQHIFVTGNTVLDALSRSINADFTSPLTEWAKGSRMLLLTLHRRESLGEPMRKVFRAISRIADDFPDVKIVYPVHLNPEIGVIARELLGGHERIRLTAPIGMTEFHNLLDRSYLVLTDSGGIQEEAAALGKPTLILRNISERREELLSGSVKIAGTEEDEVYADVARLLESAKAYADMQRTVKNVDGGASAMIADILCEWSETQNG